MILMSGFDTSSRMLTAALYFLQTYPDVKEKLTEEILKVIKTEEEITKDKLEEIEYLSYFV